MKRSWKWILGIVVVCWRQSAQYLMAMGMMASIYAYRSPLHDNPPQPGEVVGEPLSERMVFVLIDALRLNTCLPMRRSCRI